MEAIIKIRDILWDKLSFLFLELKIVLSFLLFNRKVQKHDGPIIMILYFSLNVFLLYIFHFLLAPSFKISWYDSLPNFTYCYLRIGYSLSFLAFTVYIAVFILGPGNVD